MKDEYDFSRGERGKFYRPDAKLNVPVYLEEDVREFVEELAERRHSDVSTVANELIRADMRSADA
jgi:hypothetical protein